MTTPAQPVPPAEPQPAPPPARGGKRRQITVLLSLVALLGLLLGLAWFFNRDQAINAKAGDCLHDLGHDKLKIVACGSADADFVVLGKVTDQPQTFSPFSSVCDPFAGTTNTYWQGVQGKNGDLLCIKKN